MFRSGSVFCDVHPESEMIAPARRLCYRILCQIESRRLFSDDALNSDDTRQLEVRDRHLTMEIVYGTLRWQGLLDFVLAELSSRPWPEVTPGARILLRMSLYQMWQMDRIPDHALVNDAVELAKRELGQGTDRYLNGVLRNLTRRRPWKEKEFLRKAPPWVRVSLPQWLWERWVDRYGADTAEAFALSLNMPPQAALRIHGSYNSRDLPFEAVPSDLVPDAYIRTSGDREQECGKGIVCHFQDEASQLIPHLLGPDASGWRIWDACAAPGGKCVILCKICGEKGRVIASDARRGRIARLVGFLNSSGMPRPEVVIADARKSAPFRICFDAILADVPCSGLGTLRRNPEIKWQFLPAQFSSLQETQTEILHSVSEAVRKGGCLLYSTCSTEPEENEHVINSFLSRHTDFSLRRPIHPTGIENWTSFDAMVRTFPGTRLWDGFFAALLVRR